MSRAPELIPDLDAVPVIAEREAEPEALAADQQEFDMVELYGMGFSELSNIANIPYAEAQRMDKTDIINELLNTGARVDGMTEEQQDNMLKLGATSETESLADEFFGKSNSEDESSVEEPAEEQPTRQSSWDGYQKGTRVSQEDVDILQGKKPASVESSADLASTSDEKLKPIKTITEEDRNVLWGIAEEVSEITDDSKEGFVSKLKSRVSRIFESRRQKHKGESGDKIELAVKGGALVESMGALVVLRSLTDEKAPSSKFPRVESEATPVEKPEATTGSEEKLPPIGRIDDEARRMFGNPAVHEREAEENSSA